MKKLCTPINEHKNRICAGMNKKNTYFVKHFTLSDHSVDDFSFQIIEVIDKTDASFKYKLLFSENFWICAFVTAYPYDLNNNIMQYGNISDGLVSANSRTQPYFLMPMTRRPRPHGKS